MTDTTKKQKGTILRVSAYLFRYKSLFWLTIGLAGSMTLLEIAVPYSIKVILDDIQGNGQANTLVWGVALIALLYVGSEVFNCFRIRVNNKLEQQVLLEMRRDLHTKLLHLPVSFYDQRKSGEISSRVIEDVAAVEHRPERQALHADVLLATGRVGELRRLAEHVVGGLLELAGLGLGELEAGGDFLAEDEPLEPLHQVELAPDDGGVGAVRIIWPGNERQFPSTRTADE